MIPFHFGSSRRLLFGVHHLPAERDRGAVVIAAPWGNEYLRAHRALVVLGRELASAGMHVLRFDWYGSGDSGGTELECVPPRGWREDLELAVDELLDVSGHERVHLVGVRLGGWTAAEVAGARSDISSLVLWDPVLSGATYLHELERAGRILAAPEGYRDDDGAPLAAVEISGAPMTDDTLAEVQALDGSALATRLPRMLLLTTIARARRSRGAKDPLEGRSARLDAVAVQGSAVWQEEGEFGSSEVPVEALARVREWLE